jgi:hypothetical protein
LPSRTTVVCPSPSLPDAAEPIPPHVMIANPAANQTLFTADLPF